MDNNKDKIINFEDILKLMMNCKCYNMMDSVSSSMCAINGGCDGSCSMFKNVVNQYKTDIEK